MRAVILGSDLRARKVERATLDGPPAAASHWGRWPRSVCPCGSQRHPATGVVARATHREIARALGVGARTASDTAARARDAGLDWEAVEALGDDELEAKLYPRSATVPGRRPEPDPAQIDLELRWKEVTLRLLHLEQHPGGVGYTQFCDPYRAWLRDRQLDRVELCRRLKANEATADVGAIPARARASSDVEASPGSGGAWRLVRKPLDIAVVLDELGVRAALHR